MEDSDSELDEEIRQYLKNQQHGNPKMAEIRIDWVRDKPKFGSQHIRDDHNLEESDVEEVLLEMPSSVESKQKLDEPGRTIFWGANRLGRWIFVVCEDFIDNDGIRVLRPITAFEPEQGRGYWERQ